MFVDEREEAQLHGLPCPLQRFVRCFASLQKPWIVLSEPNEDFADDGELPLDRSLDEFASAIILQRHSLRERPDVPTGFLDVVQVGFGITLHRLRSCLAQEMRGDRGS